MCTLACCAVFCFYFVIEGSKEFLFLKSFAHFCASAGTLVDFGQFFSFLL